MEEIRQDILEIQNLLTQATRIRVKTLLMNELERAEKQLKALEKAQAEAEAAKVKKSETNPPSQTKVSSDSVFNTEAIKNYSWDQETDIVSIYINLKDVGALGRDAVKLVVEDQSLDLVISEYQGKNWRLIIPKLHTKVKKAECSFTLKPNYVIVKLRKGSMGSWTSLKEEKKFNPVKNIKEGKEDPQKGLMDMMKRMYDEGDDQMKRTIGEAWTKAADEKKNNNK
jgi:calcyclin binding protein